MAPEAVPAEPEHHAEGEDREQRPRPCVGAGPQRAQADAGQEEQGDDGEALVVEELAGEQPAELLLRAVGVVEDRALVVLAARRPLGVGDQRHEEPRPDEDRADGHDRAPPDVA